MNQERIPPGHTRPPRHTGGSQGAPKETGGLLSVPSAALARRLHLWRKVKLICIALLAVQILVAVIPWLRGPTFDAEARVLIERVVRGETRTALLERYGFHPRSDLGLAPDHRQLMIALRDPSLEGDSLWALRDEARALNPAVDILDCMYLAGSRLRNAHLPKVWEQAGCQAVYDVLAERQLLPEPTAARPFNILIAPFLPVGFLWLALIMICLLLTLPWLLLRYEIRGALVLAVGGTVAGMASYVLVDGLWLGRDASVHGPAYALAGLFGAQYMVGFRRLFRRGPIKPSWYGVLWALFVLWVLANDTLTGGADMRFMPGISIFGALGAGALLAVVLQPEPNRHRKRLRSRRA